jgi:DNA-binding beta-propeller fold protein YncE
VRLLPLAAVLAVLAAPSTASGAFGVVAEWGGNGTEAGRFDRPNEIAVAPDGSLVIGDTRNGRLQRFDGRGGFLGTIGSALDRPNDVAVAPDGGLVVPELGANRLTLLGGGRQDVVPSSGPGLRAPAGAAFVGDELWVTQASGDGIQAFGARDGRYVRAVAAGVLASASGLAPAPDGSVLVADTGNHRVVRLSADGALLAAYGARGSGPDGLVNPTDVAVARDGGFWVADFGNQRLVERGPDGGVRRVVGEAGDALAGVFSYPIAVEALPGGDVLVVNSFSARVVRLGEVPDAPPPPGPPSVGPQRPDRFAPTVTLRPRGPQRRAVRVAVTCSEACVARVRAVAVAGPGRRRLALRRRTLRLAAGRARTVVLRVPRRALRRLGRGRRFVVGVSALDASGNAGRATATVAVLR